MLLASVGLAVIIVSFVLLRPHSVHKISNDPHDNNEEKIEEKNFNLHGANLEIFTDTMDPLELYCWRHHNHYTVLYGKRFDKYWYGIIHTTQNLVSPEEFDSHFD